MKNDVRREHGEVGRRQGETDRYRRYETRTIIKELSPEVIDGVRLIISFFTGPSSVMLLLSVSLPRSRRRYDCRECRRQGM